MTRRIERALRADLDGKSGTRSQLGEVGSTSLATSLPRQNRINAYQIDGYGGQDVLHMCPGQSIITGSAYSHASHSLRKGGFNARTQSILLAKRGCLFHLSLRLQGFMSRLWAHMQDATGCPGASAVL